MATGSGHASDLPDFMDIKQAARRLKGHACPTALVSHARLNKISGVNLYLKDETQQKTGSFKYRGAYSRMALLSKDELRRGVVAFSSGNHAQGVALAARELGTTAVIVMPACAPKTKKQATLALGARIVEYDMKTQSREQIAAQIARDENRILVPAFDDKFIMAGQGTIGLEIMTQAQAQGFVPDAVLAPLGGGGLCAGLGLAVKTLSPKTHIYGVEPFEFDDQYQSLKTGRRQKIRPGGQTICDALMSPMPGQLTFALNKNQLSGVFRLSDAECLLAMAMAYECLGLKLEPAGASALAAAMSHLALPERAHVVVVLSGGNVDADIFARAQKCPQAYDKV